jgi:hypothetical protein
MRVRLSDRFTVGEVERAQKPFQGGEVHGFDQVEIVSACRGTAP